MLVQKFDRANSMKMGSLNRDKSIMLPPSAWAVSSSSGTAAVEKTFGLALFLIKKEKNEQKYKNIIETVPVFVDIEQAAGVENVFPQHNSGSDGAGNGQSAVFDVIVGVWLQVAVTAELAAVAGRAGHLEQVRLTTRHADCAAGAHDQRFGNGRHGIWDGHAVHLLLFLVFLVVIEIVLVVADRCYYRYVVDTAPDLVLRAGRIGRLLFDDHQFLPLVVGQVRVEVDQRFGAWGFDGSEQRAEQDTVGTDGRQDQQGARPLVRVDQEFAQRSVQERPHSGTAHCDPHGEGSLRFEIARDADDGRQVHQSKSET